MHYKYGDTVRINGKRVTLPEPNSIGNFSVMGAWFSPDGCLYGARELGTFFAPVKADTPEAGIAGIKAATQAFKEALDRDGRHCCLTLIRPKGEHDGVYSRLVVGSGQDLLQLAFEADIQVKEYLIEQYIQRCPESPLAKGPDQKHLNEILEKLKSTGLMN